MRDPPSRHEPPGGRSPTPHAGPGTGRGDTTPGGVVFAAWEYPAIWRHYGWAPDAVDAMPTWVVRRCLARIEP